MSATWDLLVVGDANPDVVVSGAPADPPWGHRERLVDAGALTLGGSAAITACGAARLGLRTAFAGRVGDDPAGRFCLDALRERGVDVTGCVIDPDRPTALTVVLASGGDRAMLTAPGCLPFHRPDDLDPGLVAAARHVHVSSYFLQPRLAAALPAWFAGLRAAGATTSLDTNDDPSGAWDSPVTAAIARTDVFLPNEAEALALTGTDDVGAAAEKLAASAGLVVVKRGAAGALAWTGDGPVTVAAHPVTPVDTVGAGDSFNAGFLAGRLGGLDLAGSLRLAAACGALSTRAAGGTAAQPTLAEARA
ncbi:carbohydrate kinase family protein [Actinoplanes sp. M2I2]|uniref:carbohydrate kinase family protein n=1 Tax=Actinoplanes sp. M2I2 TaxID=1734444 RepID=UPI0020208B69|nr:carbohydrate kinase family protein [Actinoplanes sp. M2I2]